MPVKIRVFAKLGHTSAVQNIPNLVIIYVGNGLFSFRKVFVRRNKRRIKVNVLYLSQRIPEQSHQSDSARKRFAYAFHHFELLRTAHIKLPFLVVPVNVHFYLFKQDGGFLNFVHEHGRRIVLEKRAALFLCGRPDDNVVKRCVTDIFCDFFQHSRFADLPRTVHQYCAEHFR